VRIGGTARQHRHFANPPGQRDDHTGRYVALLPASLLRLAGKRLSFRILPVELPSPPRPVGIVTVKNRTLSPFGQRFVDCARQVAKPLAAPSGRARAGAPA